MKVYSYVIVVDDGGAPNFEAPFTTLAICKPKIRHHAEPGDLVIAFTGRTLGPEPHAVRWAGVVAERLTFAEYWRDVRFAGKKPGAAIMPDNIYSPRGAFLDQIKNEKHDQGNIATDLGGEYVLVFKQSWYFGPTTSVLPQKFGLRIIGGRRGNRVTTISNEQWCELKEWLDHESPALASQLNTRALKRRMC
jgi:hypothetical protein